MGRQRAARRRGGGGESIPPLRTLLLRVGAAAGAAALAVGLAAYPVLRAGQLAPAVLPLAVLALLFVLVAILARGRLAGPALFTLAAEYVVVEATGRAGASSVLAYAVGLVLFCELLMWSAELPPSMSADRAVVFDRLGVLVVIALAAALLALVALAAAGLQLAGAFEAALVGSGAAVILLAFPWLLLRKGGDG